MSENFTYTDQLIQYLDGELEGEMLSLLQQKIASDENLANELESLRLTKAAMQAYGLKSTIGTLHKEIMEELQPKATRPVTPVRRLVTYSLRIAAVLMIVAGSGVLFQYITTTPQQLFSGKFVSYQLTEMRGNTGNDALELAYKKGLMPEAVNAFKQLTAPTAKDYFLYGSAALQLKDPVTAIVAFQFVQSTNAANQTHFFEEDAAYFLGLAYLDNNQPQQALPVFEEIYKDSTHPYHDKIDGWFMQRLRKLAH